MRINPEKDKMVPLTEGAKIRIKRIGYDECARLLRRTPGYMRHLASKGKRRIRETHLRIIEQE